MFRRITKEDIDFLVAVAGSSFVFTSEEVRSEFAADHTEDLVFFPEVVVKPRSAEEISEILRYATRENIPVTPAGARTGLSGGALPVFGGIVLGMERFNEILHLDESNMQVTVEPGVITEILQNAVCAKGLFYPPDPASRGSCFIGGNIAENSGGPKAVKYGVVKDYVLNLEVVLPTGEIIQTGANVLKNATGYNLTQLFVGSEGTLGVITKIVLRLIPHPKHDLLLLVPFADALNACGAVAAIFKAGITPSGLEFMERDAIELVMEFEPSLKRELGPQENAHLLIELDGNDLASMQADAETIAGIVEQFHCGEILFATSEREKQDLWRIRRKVGEAVKHYSVYKEEDTVVPRAALPTLLEGVKKIGSAYHFRTVCYGHAGDGNLHVNILRGDLSDATWQETLPLAINELFALVISLGGTLSGEHGIGWVQKQYMPLAFSDRHLEIFRAIKQLFDPAGILNPGKVVD